jgi:hypothetical protein
VLVATVQHLDGKKTLQAYCAFPNVGRTGDGKTRHSSGVEHVSNRSKQRWLVVDEGSGGYLLLKVAKTFHILLVREVGSSVTDAACGIMSVATKVTVNHQAKLTVEREGSSHVNGTLVVRSCEDSEHWTQLLVAPSEIRSNLVRR